MQDHGKEVESFIKDMDSGLGLMKEIGKPEDIEAIRKFIKESIIHLENLKKLYGGKCEV